MAKGMREIPGDRSHLEFEEREEIEPRRPRRFVFRFVSRTRTGEILLGCVCYLPLGSLFAICQPPAAFVREMTTACEMVLREPPNV